MNEWLKIESRYLTRKFILKKYEYIGYTEKQFIFGRKISLNIKKNQSEILKFLSFSSPFFTFRIQFRLEIFFSQRNIEH